MDLDFSSVPGLATGLQPKRAEYAKRRRDYNERKVAITSIEDYRKEGWEPFKESKTGISIRRKKPNNILLKNRLWCILYSIGYDALDCIESAGFSIQDTNGEFHNIADVFAIDAETIIVARCDSALGDRKRLLKIAIANFADSQRSTADRIRQTFGRNHGRKIIWILCAGDARWSAADIELAHQSNIYPLQQRELWYFYEIAKKIGHAAKYQFHAEFLRGKKIPALEARRVPATRTKLGGRQVYLFSARPIDILRISFVNHRDLRDPDGVPTYQRIVHSDRLKKIGRFLDEGGYFPNTILINFRRRLRFDRIGADDASDMQFGYLTLPDRYKSAWVIDGQHRLLGCTNTRNPAGLANLFFLAFADLPPEMEADLFVTINMNKEQCPKS